VDISRTAIDHADKGLGTYHVADLCAFDPAALAPYDVVVFNEVLYYLGVDEAVAQVARYAAALAPGGPVLFSLKDDPKSHAILRGITARFPWETGVVWQERPDRAEHAVRTSAERPAFLVGVVRGR
jgi:predicted TPR repeat methyltransferase